MIFHQNETNKLLNLVNISNAIVGRKKFQKIVYILQCEGVSFHKKFKYYYYGPFSPSLQLEIDELVDRKILIEKMDTSYSYELNPQTEFESNREMEEKKELILFLNKQETRILELISTIYFLHNEGWEEQRYIKKKIETLKPHLSSLIDESFDIKKEIEEITTK
ncbi:MAG: hypothetical protein LBK45_00730 [Tannerellaceae bacterium]|jgi:uncharacterized protein YwgA|nr:hypothetical protein [Tannerellaceae bacterium]